VLQGIGAALVSANGSALLVSAFPAEERGKALGAFGAMVGVGLAIGSPLGGIVIHHASWRWLFFVNLPLGVLTLWLLNSRVQDDRLVQELPGGPWVLRRPAAGAPRLDVWAAATWCGALAALMLAISRGPAVGWANPQTLGLFAAMAVLLLLFVVVERRTPHPMLPLQILFGPLGAAVLLTLLSQAMTMAVGFHMPMYLEEVLHFDTQKSGMWNAILPLFALFCAPLAGRLSDRIGARVLTTLGMALACAGFVILAGLGVDTPPWHLFAGLGVMGAGLGLFSVPNASALLSLVPREQLGIASGLQGTTRNLGFSSGIALMGVLVASGYRAHTGHAMAGTGAPVSPVGFAAATHDAYLVMAVIAVVATLLAAVQDRKAPVRKDPAPAR
jgi:MFS family permease